MTGLANYYGLPPLPREVLSAQRELNRLTSALLECNYYLWKVEVERVESRWLDWLKFDEQEETLCKGEMR